MKKTTRKQQRARGDLPSSLTIGRAEWELGSRPDTLRALCTRLSCKLLLAHTTGFHTLGTSNQHLYVTECRLALVERHEALAVRCDVGRCVLRQLMSPVCMHACAAIDGSGKGGSSVLSRRLAQVRLTLTWLPLHHGRLHPADSRAGHRGKQGLRRLTRGAYCRLYGKGQLRVCSVGVCQALSRRAQAIGHLHHEIAIRKLRGRRVKNSA